MKIVITTESVVQSRLLRCRLAGNHTKLCVPTQLPLIDRHAIVSLIFALTTEACTFLCFSILHVILKN